jgi:RNA polymerase primary sigma factor
MKFETSETLPMYFRSIKKLEPLSKEQEKALGIRIEAGEKSAIDELVKHNLKIVVTIANRHVGQGLLIDDLIQEGNLGLYEAATKFTSNHEGRFINYASFWIRKRINEAVAQLGRIVRLPHNQEYDIYKIKMKGGETPNLRTIELDAPVGEDSDETIADRILGSKPDVERDHDAEQLTSFVNGALNTLKERDREIVKMYFGIGCDYAVPTESIAEKLGMTQIRICQIVKSSIEKMKEVC